MRSLLNKRLMCSASDFKMRRLLLTWWVAAAMAIVSCAPLPIGNKDLLGFLEVGQTSRQDVYRHLRDPSQSYEDSRILTYRIGEDEAGLFVVAPSKQIMAEPRKDWSGVRYSLVLAFDDKGVLRRQSLVQIRSP
jgi:hypothetical protein